MFRSIVIGICLVLIGVCLANLFKYDSNGNVDFPLSGYFNDLANFITGGNGIPPMPRPSFTNQIGQRVIRLDKEAITSMTPEELNRELGDKGELNYLDSRSTEYLDYYRRSDNNQLYVFNSKRNQLIFKFSYYEEKGKTTLIRELTSKCGPYEYHEHNGRKVFRFRQADQGFVLGKINDGVLELWSGSVNMWNEVAAKSDSLSRFKKLPETIIGNFNNQLLKEDDPLPDGWAK